MKDEIKEKIKAYYVANDIDEILDYITNLQEENAKVHKELDYADNYNIYLISKIDKAIEYIRENDDFYYGDELYDGYQEIIDILKGDDKDD